MRTNILIIIMSVFMAVFVIAAFQTWEFAVDHDIPPRGEVWALLAVSGGWFYLLGKMPRRRREEIENLFDRWTEE